MNARPLPRARTLLAVALACAPVVAFLEAVELHQRGLLEGGPAPFWATCARLLLPWGALALCAPLVLRVVARFPLVRPTSPRAVAAHVAAALAFPLARIALLDAIQVAMTPSLGLVAHFRWLFADIYIADVLAFSAIAAALHAVRHARERARATGEALALRAELADARLEALAHQLQPHFLFNALNSVAMLVRSGDGEAAIEVLSKLSGILRDLLRDGPAHDVPLRTEFALLENYLAIERVRFSDRLRVTFELETAVAESPVPFLILQPLVENAVRHGVSRRTGPATITVRGESAGGGIRLVVDERGEGAAESRANQGMGVGLRNTRERLAARFGDRAVLELSVGSNGSGSVAQIEILA